MRQPIRIMPQINLMHNINFLNSEKPAFFYFPIFDFFKIKHSNGKANVDDIINVCQS